MGIATTEQKSVGSPPTGAKDAYTMKGRTDRARTRSYVSAVSRPSLAMPCPMETEICMQLLMRKSLRLLTAKKRRVSTSLRLYPSHPIATRTMIVTATPGSVTPPMKT
eukprot:12730455-Ditylum_brightwellii.AAC.1